MPWTKVADSRVRHLWKCEEEDCEDGNPEAEVDPSFYQNNGEPCCISCDKVMTYLRTEVDV